jgi:hypothetical protein
MAHRIAATVSAIALMVACQPLPTVDPSTPAIPTSTPGPAALRTPLIFEAQRDPQSELRVLVVDRGGLVVGAIVIGDPRMSDPSEDLEVRVDPGGLSLSALWRSGPCDLGPAVTVDGTAGALNLTVERGALSDDNCEAMGVIHGVRIAFSSPVSAEGVTIRLGN